MQFIYYKITLIILILFSALLSYSPFTTEPTFIINTQDLIQPTQDRIPIDPNWMSLGPDGNFHVLLNTNYNKITPTGEILVPNAPILDEFNGLYRTSYCFDNSGNVHIVLEAYDTEPDTIIHYYGNEGEFWTSIEYQRKLWYHKLSQNFEPIEDFEPFVINTDYIAESGHDLILGQDGLLHIVGKFSLADIQNGHDIPQLYYIQLNLDGAILVNYETIFDEDDNPGYSFNNIELIQDSENTLQFTWYGLSGINWYKIDTEGNLLDDMWIQPSSSCLSLFPITEEEFDLIIRWTNIDSLLFSHIYPDGTLIDMPQIPYPQESIGNLEMNSGWSKDCIDLENNSHGMYYRFVGDDLQTAETKYYYQKIDYNGNVIIPPYEVDLLRIFQTNPQIISSDENNNPVMIISPASTNDLYFAWLDPDSVRVIIDQDWISNDTTVIAPLLIKCDHWEDLLPIKHLQFQIDYPEELFEILNITFSSSSELMNLNLDTDNGDIIGILISDQTSNVIYSGEEAILELEMSLIQNELINEPIPFYTHVSSAIDSLNYDLDTSGDGDISYLNLLGDINTDWTINVLDVVQCVRIILNEVEPSLYQKWAVDLNSDLINDVLDIIEIVTIILD